MLSLKLLDRTRKFEIKRGFQFLSINKMSNKCKIGVCQVTSNPDKEQCVQICKDLILKAKENGAKVF